MKGFIFGDIDNDYVAIGLAFLVALYGLSMGRIRLPGYLRNLFSNTLFRIVFLSMLLIFNFRHTPHIAVAVALIFVLTLEYLNKEEAQENFVYLQNSTA